MNGRKSATRPSWGAAWLLVVGCGAADRPAPMEEPEHVVELVIDTDGRDEAKKRKRSEARGSGAAPPAAAPASKSEMASDEPMAMPAAEAPAEAAPEEAAPTRAWFPETFLFEPLVETDAEGRATVTAVIPDRLTGWRVLALAHSRDGAQAGTTATLRGTLPAYVDPVVPAFLLAGDEVRLPVQVVNTTDGDISANLTVASAGSLAGGGGGAVRVPARSSRVETVTLRALRAGEAALTATLSGTDSILRTFPVYPAGRKIEQARGGSLAAPREVEIVGPADLDPESTRVRLAVYPGALAVLRCELARASSRGGSDVAGDAHALLLAGRSADLLTKLGDEPDRPKLREISLLAAQRAVRHARVAQLDAATLLAEAALAHPENPVMSRLGERLVSSLASQQRPDGTFGGGNGETLQHLLVITADAARALSAAPDLVQSPLVRRQAEAALVRAGGAFERHAVRRSGGTLTAAVDGYTAAAILASGAAPRDIADALRPAIIESVDVRSDGSRVLVVPDDVVRADGRPPNEIEATALAALALQGSPDAPWVADLGASLLGAYHPSWGWGDGRTDLSALQAVVRLFSEPLPDAVRVVLEMDGRALTEGSFDRAKLRDILLLESPAPGAAGPHTWSVRAEPPVAGLGFSLALESWVPWEAASKAPGLELRTDLPPRMRAGEAAALRVATAAPSGMAVRVRIGLPAGVQPDALALDALEASGALLGWESEDGSVTIDVPDQEPGRAFSAEVRVIPTLSGALRAPPATIAPLGSPEVATAIAPVVWRID